MGAVDKGLGQVELASTFEVLGQTAQQSLEHRRCVQQQVKGPREPGGGRLVAGEQ